MVFDWSGLTTRHPAQVVTEQDLLEGDVYACVRACGGRVNVIERVFVGMYCNVVAADIINRMRVNGWHTKQCFSLHTDGWIEDDFVRMNVPTAVYWRRSTPSGGRYYGDMFGLRDSTRDHSIVVPLVWWLRNPTMDGGAGIATAASPRCPDCKGTGTVMLFTSSVPCGCKEGA